MNNTVGQQIRWVEQQLEQAGVYFGHGTDNAWDEAVQLVLHAMNLPIDSDSSIQSRELTLADQQQIQLFLQQRIEQRLPLPYITHQAWFMRLPFYVDQRVIIPRSPFGEWIERQFSPWIDAKNVKRILDLGTGSGCMAIAAALAFPDATVDAIDISPEALAVAKINVEFYALTNRVQLIHSNGFQALTTQRYDMILSNPPYVSAAEMQDLPAEYLHEPRSGLEAEDEGLQIVEDILQQAKTFLNPQGILVVEVGNQQELLQARHPQLPLVWLEQEHGGHGLFVITREELGL